MASPRGNIESDLLRIRMHVHESDNGHYVTRTKGWVDIAIMESYSLGTKNIFPRIFHM